ncbi:AAA family ATPase [Trichloromonas sp.]|uniref:AAA family ATPase n=1 Tax=Trichloromonas sp. TaxID=3069249 RepID=UPI002A481602|nr:AAA family ATPase [Trichloromonas sp.]
MQVSEKQIDFNDADRQAPARPRLTIDTSPEAFREAIREILGHAPDATPPGKLVRFATSDRRGDLSGWAKLFDDGEGGVFGDWRDGMNEVWQARQPLTDQERRDFAAKVKAAREQADQERAKEQAACRKRSTAAWEAAAPADPAHPYLVKKGVMPYQARQSGGRLLIPVMDTAGTIHGLQSIDAEGGKRFESGTAKRGNFSPLGEPRDKTLLLCEGFATGATIHEATGEAVAVAFDAGNLRPVAEALRGAYPDWRLIVCADDDHGTLGNPGIKNAIQAAEAVGGLLAVPDFAGTERGPKDTDFNDLAKLAGMEAVKACIVDAAGPMPTPGPLEENAVAGEFGSEEPAAARLKIVDVADFLSLEFPPRENILAPWLPRQGLCMVYAPRGLGKTHFSLGVSYAVATGGTFLTWSAPAPRGVLFLDGEMPGVVLQERLARIVASNDKEPAAPLRIVTPDLQARGMLNLSDPAEQAALEPFLDGVDLIVVDNLSTLCRSGKEAEGESWLPVQEWALRQRAAGRSVLFVHHSGKNGEQRGTSRREDVLDTVIALRRPCDYSPDKGACFEVHFEKARGIYGDETKSFEATLTTGPDGRQEWLMKNLEESTAEKVAKLLKEGVPQGEIADMLGLTKGAVSKAKKRAENMGLIDNPRPPRGGRDSWLNDD